MRNKVAKRLRRMAEDSTIGADKAYTRRVYKSMKRQWMRGRRTMVAQPGY